ncbi:hypothetical protein [Maribacter sp. 2304DJ31-5]|uniref:hypothetical protein n=1 Tax=Maribacter sp. 2304DJ31-5 TaxID=3386273 RepID=UPI0039BD890F
MALQSLSNNTITDGARIAIVSIEERKNIKMVFIINFPETKTANIAVLLLDRC